jgi:hypothetical protein
MHFHTTYIKRKHNAEVVSESPFTYLVITDISEQISAKFGTQVSVRLIHFHMTCTKVTHNAEVVSESIHISGHLRH